MAKKKKEIDVMKTLQIEIKPKGGKERYDYSSVPFNELLLKTMDFKPKKRGKK